MERVIFTSDETYRKLFVHAVDERGDTSSIAIMIYRLSSDAFFIILTASTSIQGQCWKDPRS